MPSTSLIPLRTFSLSPSQLTILTNALTSVADLHLQPSPWRLCRGSTSPELPPPILSTLTMLPFSAASHLYRLCALSAEEYRVSAFQRAHACGGSLILRGLVTLTSLLKMSTTRWLWRRRGKDYCAGCRSRA